MKLEPLNVAKCLLELPQGDLLYIIYDLDLEINSLTVDINLGVNPWVGILLEFRTTAVNISVKSQLDLLSKSV